MNRRRGHGMTHDGAPLERKVAALLQPGAYAQPPSDVCAVETHMSWVFLTPELAYKLKKPVRADGLDFGTTERRHFYCLEEQRLNRRLAPWVYLDVLALRQDRLGAIRTFGEGRVIDWLVLMRRLPAALMLDCLLAQGLATADHLRRVAEVMAAFYRTLAPAARDPTAYLARLAREIDHAQARLCDPELAFDGEAVHSVCAVLRGFLHDRADQLAARVLDGRIVEGHGDLRPEHVWLGAPPAVIDCLEFSQRLRTLDCADELGFLALECERAGAPELGGVLLARSAEVLGDAPPAPLIHFYQALRACVRGGLALWHLKEARYRGSPVWAERTRRYVELAAAHARGCAG